ncbi:MAG: hypothetical protein H0X34_13285 [Chthoniobacterales bacterium]|nr:hypothetical protein [Chthoniobacterales bacterium]
MSDEDTREYFNTVATQWDDMRQRFFGEGVRVAAIRAAEISPALSWLMSASGLAFWQKKLWRPEHG